MKMETITTEYIVGERNYVFPKTIIFPIKSVEVFNKKNNTWTNVDFQISLVLNRKKRKTDEVIKVFYVPQNKIKK